jgi:hypothetical protein
VNGPKIVVLSDRIWRERFDGTKDHWRTHYTDEQGFTVGCYAADIRVPKGVDLWLPIRTTVSRATESYGATFLSAVAGRRVLHDQAEDEMNTIVANRGGALKPKPPGIALLSRHWPPFIW